MCHVEYVSYHEGEYVAESLQDYFRRIQTWMHVVRRMPQWSITPQENPEKFKETARIFLHEQVNVEHVDLE